MKWLSQAIIWIYALASLYFFYIAAMGVFIYMANKSMGHYESFLVPGRNLALGFIMGAFAFGGWSLLKNPSTYKWAMTVIYFPAIMALLVLLVFLFIFFSGARWN